LGLRIKNVIMKEVKVTHDLPEGLEVLHRNSENGENYMSLMGTKQQINHYLQDKPILSDRLRTLNSVPKYRIINSVLTRIY